MFWFFSFQIYSLNPVPSLLWLFISDLCSSHLSLNDREVKPVYISWLFVSPLVTVASYTKPLVWQAPFSRHVRGPLLQLQPGAGGWIGVCLDTLELCLEMTWPMLGIHLYDTLMVFRLMILAKGWDGGKHVSIILRNFAPTFVATFLEKGGLNQVIFLDLFLP